MILSIDPGVRGCGCALFSNEQKALQRAAYVVNPIKKGQDVAAAIVMAQAVFEWVFTFYKVPSFLDWFVVEVPRVYDHSHQKGDQNTSIIPLTLVVGALAGRINPGRVIQYFPRDWKGTVDADTVAIPLIQSRLTELEKTRIEMPSAASLEHNVWDGIGIGLKSLGRLEPRRIFHKEP